MITTVVVILVSIRINFFFGGKKCIEDRVDVIWSIESAALEILVIYKPVFFPPWRRSWTVGVAFKAALGEGFIHNLTMKTETDLLYRTS